jgi:hypothetical protein
MTTGSLYTYAEGFMNRQAVKVYLSVALERAALHGNEDMLQYSAQSHSSAARVPVKGGWGHSFPGCEWNEIADTSTQDSTSPYSAIMLPNTVPASFHKW